MDKKEQKAANENLKTAYSKRKITLLEHIEKIVDLSERSKLSDDFFEKAAEPIQAVSRKLKLSPKQTVYLSVFIDLSDRYRLDVGDLAKHFDCRRVRILQEIKELEALENLEYIRCSRSKSEKRIQYRIVPEVVEAFQKNEIYLPPNQKNLSIDTFFDVLDDLFEAKKSSEVTFEKLHIKIRDLFLNNIHLNFVKQVDKYKFDNEDLILFCYFCLLFVRDNDDNIGFHDLDEIFDKSSFRTIKSSLLGKWSNLFYHKLIENTCSDGFADKESFKLTDFSKIEILSELEINTSLHKSKKDIVTHTSIISKELFYNGKEQKQIEQLSNLLDKDNFDTIRNRLQDNGMRKGFACLFYGSPGTGKTETVYQLARKTGRDIFPVNVSQIKSMWVGESEKNIKNVFERYNNHVQQSEIVPILLFNEADAVLGIRRNGATNAVDKMENSIQNIILEEMEKLEGILIATTNLTQNLDKAFERRFIYKIEFGRPSFDAKQSIWETMIPTLTVDELQSLASTYDFSGGQIENIARKYTVHHIINGKNPSLDELHELCSSEILHDKLNRKKIGF